MADSEFILLGDALWLDFANTTRCQAGLRDALPDPASYHRWCKAVRAQAPADSDEWVEAIALRHVLRELARSLDEGRGAPASAVAAVNNLLRQGEGRQQLVRLGGAWHLQFHASRPASALEAVARSAAATLAQPLIQVRRCVGQNCGLFISDDTPSQQRRWCSGERCGRTGRIERRRSSRPVSLVPEN
jgi:predicted RNA-binding Zn ribbon-like protein